MKHYVTSESMEFDRAYSAFPKEMAKVIVEKGAPVEKDKYTEGTYWVKPEYFKDNAIVKADATSHGFMVPKEKVAEVEIELER